MPIVQLAAAAGEVTAIVGLRDGEGAADRRWLARGRSQVTRTSAALLAAPVAVHAKLPVLGAAASVVYVLPPSRLSSTRTVCGGRELFVQVIVWALPIAQFAPAVGAVTARTGVTIANRAARAGRGCRIGAADADDRCPRVRARDEPGERSGVGCGRGQRLEGASAVAAELDRGPWRSCGRLLDQAMVCAEPAYQVVAAVGPVTDRAGVTTANAPLAPLAKGGPFRVTRTSAAAASGPVAVQTKLPVLGAAAASISNEAPPSRLSSMSAVATPGMLCDQLIVAGVPANSVAFAAGAVTATAGVTMANVPLKPKAPALPVAVSRRHAFAVSGPAIGQAKLPVFGADGARIVYVLPPSRLSSILIVVAGAFVVHVIGSDAPAKAVIPAAGPVTFRVAKTMENTPLVAVAGAEPIAVTRTIAFVVGANAANEVKVPVNAAIEGATIWYVAPPSRVSSILTLVPLGRFWLVQVTVKGDETNTVLPAAGAVTVNDGAGAITKPPLVPLVIHRSVALHPPTRPGK